VRVRNPKIKWPNVQYVLLESPLVRALLAGLKTITKPLSTDRMFTMSPLDLARRWARLLAYAGIQGVVIDTVDALERKFTLGGLHPGGATAHYLAFQDLGRLQWRGRWAILKTLKHYIQLSGYHNASIHLSPGSELLLAEGASIVMDVLNCSWSGFTHPETLSTPSRVYVGS
jgi:hypothetical protein